MEPLSTAAAVAAVASPTVSRLATETPSLNSLLAARTAILRGGEGVSSTRTAAAADRGDDSDDADYDLADFHFGGMQALESRMPPLVPSSRRSTVTRTTTTTTTTSWGPPSSARGTGTFRRRFNIPWGTAPSDIPTYHFYRPALPSPAAAHAVAAARAPRRSSRVASLRSVTSLSSSAIGSTSAYSVPFTATTRSATAAAAASARPSSSSSSSRKRKSRDSESPPAKRARRSSANSSQKKPPSNAKNDSDYDDDDVEVEEDDRKPSASSSSSDGAVCCVCMCEPSKEEASNISGCKHIFCFGCISKWADRENTCPLCKVRFTKITRVNKVRKRKGGSKSPIQNVKNVKNCDQRSDLVSGSALEAMLNSIAAANGSSTRIGHFLAVMGGGMPARSFASAGAAAGARSSSASASRMLNVYDSDDDDDDEDSDSFPTDFGAFMRQAIRSTYAQARHAASSSRPHRMTTSTYAAASASSSSSPPEAFIFGSSRMTAVSAAVASMPARSFATNGSDQSAGRARENPLNIDDDSDDEIEVLQVARRTLP